MNRVRNHPLVLTRSLHEQTGYDEAEDLVRGDARRGDAAAKKAVAEIDAAEAKMTADSAALNQKMAAKLGMTLDQVDDLIATLEADSLLESWLMRRLHLTRSEGRRLLADEHHINVNPDRNDGSE